MKLFDFWIFNADEDHRDSIGVEWCMCHEGPNRNRSIAWPDQDYYAYLHLEFYFIRKILNIDIRLNKLPYRNYDEFLINLRARRKAKMQEKL